MLVSFGGCYIVIMLWFAKDAWKSSNTTDVPMVIRFHGGIWIKKNLQNKHKTSIFKNLESGIHQPWNMWNFPSKLKGGTLFFWGTWKHPNARLGFTLRIPDSWCKCRTLASKNTPMNQPIEPFGMRLFCLLHLKQPLRNLGDLVSTNPSHPFCCSQASGVTFCKVAVARPTEALDQLLLSGTWIRGHGWRNGSIFCWEKWWLSWLVRK